MNYRVVEFSLEDIREGVKEAREHGFLGNEADVEAVAAKLITPQGTVNPRGKKWLSCKKCGGGIGVCKGGVCIGISPGPPPMIKLTIPI